MGNSQMMISNYLTQLEGDLRIPVTSIIGSVERISHENADAALHEDLVNIRKAAEGLLILTDDLIDIVRINNNELKIADDDYDFEDVIFEIRHLLEKQTLAKGIESEMIIDNNLPCRFFGDKNRILKMLKRLVRKGIEETDEGKVSFQVTCLPGILGTVFVRFDVTDTSDGVLEEDVVSALSGKNTEGLISEAATTIFILKSIATYMGGKLTARARRGEGVTFTLLISQRPVGVATFNDRMNKDDDSYASDQHFTLVKKLRALVVGEDKEVALLGQQAIYRYRIGSDITDNVEEALELIKRIRYDVVLASENMKLPDGTGIVDAIRALADECPEKAAHIRRLPVVGIEPVNDIDAVPGEGFVGHARIPFRSEEMEEIMKNQLPAEIIRYMSDHSYSGKGLDSLEQLGLKAYDAFARFGSDAEGYRRALLSTCRSSDTKGKMLNYYLDQSDYKNYIVIVHSMIEAAQLIGSEELAAEGKELEKAAKFNPGPELIPASEAFAADFEKTLVAVRSIITDRSEEARQGAIDREDLLYIVNELRGYLSNYQITEVEELFFTLAQFSYENPKVMEYIHEAEEYMLGYNYNEVMASLDRIVALIEN